MANEFKVRKGLIVQGSGSTGDETLLDVQGNQGQLFSVTDSLIGDIFTVSDISGIPILNVSSSGVVEAGTFGSYGLIVNGSNITSSGNMNLGGGKITLEGTGQILGVDTVSNGTDAANKTYVDNAVSGLAGGTVTGVSGTSPINSNGSSTTPTISIDTANASTTGALTSTDWNTFNNKTSNTGTVTGVSGTSPVASSGGTTPTISMAAANTSTSGYLTSADWNTFDTASQKTITDFTDAGSSTITLTLDQSDGSTLTTSFSNPQGTVTGVSGTAPVVSSGGTSPTISMPAASTGTSGYLTSANWNTFNGKANITGTTANGIITLNSSAPNGIASSAVTLGDDGQGNNRNAMTFNRYSSIDFAATMTATANSSGILMKRGSTTTTQGQVYYYTSSETWALSDRNNTATQATGLLAYALDNSSTGDGMMLSGFVFKEEHGFTIGAPLYLSATPGNITNTVPTSGWARVVGYAVGENTIYFSPDRTWVELG